MYRNWIAVRTQQGNTNAFVGNKSLCELSKGTRYTILICRTRQKMQNWIDEAETMRNTMQLATFFGRESCHPNDASFAATLSIERKWSQKQKWRKTRKFRRNHGRKVGCGINRWWKCVTSICTRTTQSILSSVRFITNYYSEILIFLSALTCNSFSFLKGFLVLSPSLPNFFSYI